MRAGKTGTLLLMDNNQPASSLGKETEKARIRQRITKCGMQWKAFLVKNVVPH